MTDQPTGDATREAVLAELKLTREALTEIPRRLTEVEEKGTNTARGVIGVALALLLGGMAFLWHDNRANADQNDRFEDFAFCQATYNQANADITKVRAIFTTQLNAAQAKRDEAIGKILTTRKGDIVAVFASYNKALAAIETSRADNPIPAYPDCYSKYIRQIPPVVTPAPKG